MEAVRFAVFAEKVGPVFRDAMDVLNTPPPRDNPDAALALARVKTEAQHELPQLRRALRLDDDV